MIDLPAVLSRCEERRLLLIGDAIVDSYVYGTAIGLSAETPTVVARKIESKWSLGGAFLVARNILELGARLEVITLVGADEESGLVERYAHPRYTGSIVRDPGRRTTVKERFWVDGYKLLQLDTLDNRDLAPEHVAAALAKVDAGLPRCDAVVVSDYRHGLLTPDLIRGVIARCRASRKPLFVDSQLSQSTGNHALYRGADAVVLNLREARSIDPTFRPDGGEPEAFRGLAATLGDGAVVVKLGGEGATALIGGRVWRSGALKVQPVDTCGAGDALLAALAVVGLEDPEVALAVANRWAGLATLVHGAEPPQRAALETAS